MNNEKYIDFLYKGYIYSSEQFDKSILYVSSGTLGISVTMIDKIVDIKNVDNKWLLFTAWVLETITILLFTINHLASVRTFSNEITDEKESSIENKTLSKTLNKIVKQVNNISVATLILGIIFLLIFIIINI